MSTSATINKPIDYLVDPKIMKSAWQKQVDAANEHYEPGKFTTLIAFRSARNSPAVEIVQTKGASETHPALSPNDELAGFESKFTHLLGSGGVLGLIDKSFVRNALIDGVGFQEMIGANPFKYGIVAGADSHIAASANEEFNYPGLQEKLPPSGFHIGTLEKK